METQVEFGQQGVLQVAAEQRPPGAVGAAVRGGAQAFEVQAEQGGGVGQQGLFARAEGHFHHGVDLGQAGQVAAALGQGIAQASAQGAGAGEHGALAFQAVAAEGCEVVAVRVGGGATLDRVRQRGADPVDGRGVRVDARRGACLRRNGAIERPRQRDRTVPVDPLAQPLGQHRAGIGQVGPAQAGEETDEGGGRRGRPVLHSGHTEAQKSGDLTGRGWVMSRLTKLANERPAPILGKVRGGFSRMPRSPVTSIGSALSRRISAKSLCSAAGVGDVARCRLV